MGLGCGSAGNGGGRVAIELGSCGALVGIALGNGGGRVGRELGNCGGLVGMELGCDGNGLNEGKVGNGEGRVGIKDGGKVGIGGRGGYLGSWPLLPGGGGH